VAVGIAGWVAGVRVRERSVSGADTQDFGQVGSPVEGVRPEVRVLRSVVAGPQGVAGAGVRPAFEVLVRVVAAPFSGTVSGSVQVVAAPCSGDRVSSAAPYACREARVQGAKPSESGTAPARRGRGVVQSIESGLGAGPHAGPGLAGAFSSRGPGQAGVRRIFRRAVRFARLATRVSAGAAVLAVEAVVGCSGCARCVGPS